jgi:uncharacterized protein
VESGRLISRPAERRFGALLRLDMLKIVPGVYGVARLAADAAVPDWFHGGGFAASVRADDELTLLCLQERIPEFVEAELNWRCFRSVGPFPFNASGIVQSLIEPLSSRGYGVFVVCTFDGEHIFVSAHDWDASVDALEQAGHVFTT